MAITHSVKDFARRSGPWMLGPPVTFAVVLLIAFAVLVVSTTMLPSDLVFPLTSTLLFVLAGLVALVAWSRGRPSEQVPGNDQATPQVTYWDVAGALTFIGICAASLIDPDQMVRLMEGTHREN
jgi:peptidoglycan/LPS O-acetylase OafA/YrhL